MSVGWIALVLTLLLEQARPLPVRNPVYAIAGAVADATQDGMNAGRRRHGMYAWMLLVGGALVVAGTIYPFALSVSWWLALLVNVVVLYFTMGFRQFSPRLTEIQIALANGDLPAARHELAQWKAGIEEAPAAAEIPEMASAMVATPRLVSEYMMRVFLLVENPGVAFAAVMSVVVMPPP